MFSHRAVVYMSFFCFFNSIPTRTTDSTNAEKSATGPASNTPIIPKRSGSSRVSGIKKKVCLVNANRAPLNDFPIAVKKLEESNCTPFGHAGGCAEVSCTSGQGDGCNIRCTQQNPQ